MLIHTIAFDKDKWTTDTARKWLKDHNYTPIKRVHKTENWLRYRIRDPAMFKSFITKKENNGINIIFGIE